MEFLVLFARETDPYRLLSKESIRCSQTAAKYLESHAFARAIVADQAAGFTVSRPYGALMRDELVKAGIAPERIIEAKESSFSTQGEIEAALDAVEKLFIPEPFCFRPVAVWYHTPRIILLWWKNQQELVKPLVYAAGLFGLKQAVLEIPKFCLIFLPSKTQSWLGEVLRKKGLM